MTSEEILWFDLEPCHYRTVYRGGAFALKTIRLTGLVNCRIAPISSHLGHIIDSRFVI